MQGRVNLGQAGLYLLADLGTPRDTPGGAGESGSGEECLSFLVEATIS